MVFWTGKTSSLDFCWQRVRVLIHLRASLVWWSSLFSYWPWLSTHVINSVCPKNISHVFPGLSNSLLQGYNFLVSMHRRVVHWHAFVILRRVDGVRCLGGWETGPESTVKNVGDEHQAEQREYCDQDDRHCAPPFALMMTTVRHTVPLRRLKIKGRRREKLRRIDLSSRWNDTRILTAIGQIGQQVPGFAGNGSLQAIEQTVSLQLSFPPVSQVHEVHEFGCQVDPSGCVPFTWSTQKARHRHIYE